MLLPFFLPTFLYRSLLHNTYIEVDTSIKEKINEVFTLFIPYSNIKEFKLISTTKTEGMSINCSKKIIEYGNLYRDLIYGVNYDKEYVATILSHELGHCIINNNNYKNIMQIELAADWEGYKMYKKVGFNTVKFKKILLEVVFEGNATHPTGAARVSNIERLENDKNS